MAVRESIPPLLSTGQVLLRALDKADCLNTAFAAQCSAPSLSTPAPSTTSVPGEHHQFVLKEVSISAVAKKLSLLNARKAPGLDQISNRLLKGCAERLAKPLSHIINLSFSTGVFPDSWKKQ